MRETVIKQILTSPSVSFKLPFSIALFPDQEGPHSDFTTLKIPLIASIGPERKTFHLAIAVKVLKSALVHSCMCVYIYTCIYTYVYRSLSASAPCLFGSN